MPQIVVDGQTYDVPDGRNLLHACLSVGLDLPFFCWHPAMGSVGACRQCAVKQFRDEEDTEGRLVMACMTPASDGTRISIRDEEAAAFRARVISWLMMSHPHDCPVCDEGGECHLQDMTWMTGHVYREYGGTKRTWRNQDLGPFVAHEMNRCIQCYRCVRFYRDYAGGRDLNAFALHNTVFFGRHEDGVLESEFAGNLVEVCPTGVFTDRTLMEHYTRKWDLQTAPSICQHCGVGCNTIPGERYGSLRRIRNRYHSEVNGYFLCDRGRYGYEFVNSEQRVREPLVRRDGAAAAIPTTALDAVNRAVAELGGARGVVGVGSPRASIEGNVALRALVGPERFSPGLAKADLDLVEAMLTALGAGPAAAASLSDVREADAVLVLGEDLSNTAPVAALALRRSVLRQPIRDIVLPLRVPEWQDNSVRDAIQDARGPLIIATAYPTRVDEIASETVRAAPGDIARLGFAIADALAATGGGSAAPRTPEGERAARIAETLRQAERPLVISGAGAGSVEVVRAAAEVARALHGAGRPAGLYFAQQEANSAGTGLIGGASLEEIQRALTGGEADALVVLENDLYRRADRRDVDALIDAARTVVVIDHVLTETGKRADLLLPASTFAEGDGTFVNNEGRAQRFFQVFAPTLEAGNGAVQEGWRWARDLMRGLARPEAEGWQALDDVLAFAEEALPALRGVRDAAPGASFRIASAKVPRKPHRYSGRTAMYADRGVHEPQPPEDPDSPFSFSMEGQMSESIGPLLPREWAPGWNSPQALHRFQEEVAGTLRGGEGGARLIRAPDDSRGRAASDLDAVPELRPGDHLIVPVHHVFGSEELSMLAPAVAQLAPSPYLALAASELDELGLGEGDLVLLRIGERSWRLPVRAIGELPERVAGLPAGLPGVEFARLPTAGAIERVEGAEL